MKGSLTCARGAPLLQNHIPAKDRVNVMHDQPQKWLYNRGRAAPYYIASPEVQQTTLPSMLSDLPIILRPHLSLHNIILAVLSTSGPMQQGAGTRWLSLEMIDFPTAVFTAY